MIGFGARLTPTEARISGATSENAGIRELAFADMVADTERLGLYDADPAEVKAALKAARRKPGD